MATHGSFIQAFAPVDYIIHWNYLHTVFSQNIPPPIQRFIDTAVKSFVEGIVDTGFLSCSSRLAVANSATFGSDIIISVSPADSHSEFSEMLRLRGYEMRCLPAPVAWVSQYPSEDEYLWPTSTILFPKAPAYRDGGLEATCAGKKVYQFTACYAWNSQFSQTGGCYGGSTSSDLELGMKIVIKYGVPFMDAVFCVYYLLLRKEFMVNTLSKDRVLSNAFSLFDRDCNGSLCVRLVEELFRDVIKIMAQLEEAPAALVELVDAEIDSAWKEISLELESLRDPANGHIRWRAFQHHFSQCTPAKRTKYSVTFIYSII
jgi:hypothetical protein